MAHLLSTKEYGIRERIFGFHWGLLVLLTLIASVGIMMLYSVESSWQPYSIRHLTRFILALIGFVAIAMTPLRIWLSLAYPVYFATLFLLLLVPFLGETVNGSQRWIVLGGFQLQPSEMMKVAVVLALARYYHGLEYKKVSTVLGLVPALAMVGAPVGLTFLQPDLGTALLIGFSGLYIILLAGLSWQYIVLGLFSAFGGIVFAIQTGLLKAYQIERVTAFLDPTYDPLGANFHPNQSKIAIGSGGMSGKGLGGGTQSQLGFLPEKHTDFIFTIFGEEFGMVGAFLLLSLYLGVLLVSARIARSAKSHFGRLLAMGMGMTFVSYVLVNTGMVMGLAPVVGVPLPLVSYGGTVMLAMMGGFGLVMCVWIDRNQDTLRTTSW